jgi:hypothetical protein
MPASNPFDQFDEPLPVATQSGANPFDQFDPPELQIGSKSEPKDTSWLRQLALGGRAAAEGVTGALTLPLTGMTALRNTAPYIANTFFGGHYPYATAPSTAIKTVLDKAGAPNPETPKEQLISALTRGTTGALTMAPEGVPNAIRAGLSGLTGAGSAEGARQMGLPAWAQVGAGVIGGQAPAAIEGLGSTLWDIAKPLTSAGQRQIAGNVLNEQSSDPQSAIAGLQNNQSIVPGSMPTAGSASGDIGIMGLERGLRGRDTSAFGEQLSQQNAARQTELGSMAGTPADITAAEQARDAATNASRAAAFANAKPADINPVLGKINVILRSPVGKRDIPSQALTWLKGKLVDDQGNPETNPENLYAVRQDINDAIAGKLGGDQSKFKLAQGQLIQVRGELDNAIDAAAPGFKNYLQQYAQLSQPINRMESLQALQSRANTTAADPVTGEYLLSPSNFSRGLDELKQQPFNGLNSSDVTRLEAIRKDLQNSQAINSPLVKSPGSDTFSNFAVSNKLLSPLNKLYAPFGVDRKVVEQLTEALRNPPTAASLMQQSAAAKPFSFRPYDIGTVAGVRSGTWPNP